MIKTILAVLPLMTALPPASAAATDALTYQTPPPDIAALVDAPLTPATLVSPDSKVAALLEQPSLPSIAEVALPELRLAGLRINPRTNGQSRTRFLSDISLLSLEEKNAKPRPVTGLPANARVAYVKWSPDARHLAFTLTGEDGVTLWLADRETARAARVTDAKLNAALGSPYRWTSDGVLVAKLTLPERGPVPELPSIPRGPLVQENWGQKRPARTNPDLLKNAHDEALFDYYMTSQLARIHTDGRIERIGRPGIFADAQPSPDARLLLVTQFQRPYSYKVSLSRFPHTVEVWAPDGRSLKRLAENPLAEEVPVDFSAVRTGPRSFQWRADADATACWAEARDGGDPKREAEVRDELLCWAAPFEGKPTRLAQLALRFAGVEWGTGAVALISESWWSNRKVRTFLIAPDAPATAPRLLWDRSFEDRYSDPGSPSLRATSRGTWVIAIAPGNRLTLLGEGASPEGNRPFVDTLDLATFETQRLWRSEAPYYEQPLRLLAEDASVLLTRRESVSEPAQLFVRTVATGALRQLTNFPHPHPGLAKVEKRLIRYTRADGVPLSGMLYLPPGFVPGKSKPGPLLMWAYPSDFKTREAASQVQDSPYRFVRANVGGPLFALLMGFAVLDDPTFPIIGENNAQPNDTYVPQLVAGAEAAVAEVVRLGVADKERIAIGGHSYGAFTTANLLAHTDLFRTGIARSGAYNRTLTPFGFQQEERTFWEAKQTYVDMSPFSHADRIKEPLLLIHGEVDENSGTYPLQTERFYDALKGLGARARYVVLPAETHAYRARESTLHMLWEMNRWLEQHVAKAPLRAPKAR